MIFKVEKNVPAPQVHSNQRYPFAQMEIGDSFLINGGINPKDVANSAYNFRKAKGFKFSVRKTEDGYRCWRIK